FDQNFVEANQPLDEVARQRAAERRGRVKVLSWAVPAVVIFAILTGLAWWQTRRAQQLSASLTTIANSGISTTSDVVNEIYAASHKQPELLGMYSKTVQTITPFLETMLRIQPSNASATSLKADSLYVAADDAIRRGDKASAKAKALESIA